LRTEFTLFIPQKIDFTNLGMTREELTAAREEKRRVAERQRRAEELLRKRKTAKLAELEA